MSYKIQGVPKRMIHYFRKILKILPVNNIINQVPHFIHRKWKINTIYVFKLSPKMANQHYLGIPVSTENGKAVRFKYSR